MRMFVDHWPMLLVVGAVLIWAAIVARVCALNGRCKRKSDD